MDSNFPLVRMTNGAGAVYYARTYGWTSTGVMTSNLLASTEFALPSNLPAGTYSLVVVANGIPSDSVPFTTPLTQPSLVNLSLDNGNLSLNCANGLAGRTYILLTSTDISAPLNQWTAIETNLVMTNGPFMMAVSNVFILNQAQRFFTLDAE